MINRKTILPTYAYGDCDRLQQVLINLIKNAVDNSYMNEQILVNLNYDYTKKHLICLISDTGIGIKQEEQDKIFNPLKTNF